MASYTSGGRRSGYGGRNAALATCTRTVLLLGAIYVHVLLWCTYSTCYVCRHCIIYREWIRIITNRVMWECGMIAVHSPWRLHTIAWGLRHTQHIPGTPAGWDGQLENCGEWPLEDSTAHNTCAGVCDGTQIHTTILSNTHSLDNTAQMYYMHEYSSTQAMATTALRVDFHLPHETC